jgi:hypothetical protein
MNARQKDKSLKNDDEAKLLEDDKQNTNGEIVQEEWIIDLPSEISTNLERDERFRLEKLP